MPDSTLSAAIKEAYAQSKGVIYHTLEFRHPAFTSPIRVVRGFEDITAGLESTAPLNAGQMVDFASIAFELNKPEVSPSGVPQITITIDNVSREIISNIELSMGSTDLVQVTYREYLDSDMTTPQNDPPMTMDVMTITATPFQVSCTAGFPNLMNKKFPTQAFSSEVYPGLIA